jgi:DNA-binding NarL/FixJ family response regulator
VGLVAGVADGDAGEAGTAKVRSSSRCATRASSRRPTFDHDEYVYEAMRSGASGFLLKSVRPRQLPDAIRTVAEGESLLAPSITRRLVEELVRFAPPGEAPAALAELTDRELDVLRLIAGGHSNAEIGAALLISQATVKTHVTRVLSKLGLRDRVQAVVLAYESGLVRRGV